MPYAFERHTQPSGISLGDFAGASYKLAAPVWSHYDWTISHCILRGDNSPILGA